MDKVVIDLKNLPEGNAIRKPMLKIFLYMQSKPLSVQLSKEGVGKQADPALSFSTCERSTTKHSAAFRVKRDPRGETARG